VENLERKKTGGGDDESTATTTTMEIGTRYDFVPPSTARDTAAGVRVEWQERQHQASNNEL
jgi:hypothetical protein